MKNIKYIYFLLFGVLLAGCLEETTFPNFSADTAPTITAPAANSSYTLDESMLGQEVMSMTWEAADFGYDAAVEYVIQLDFASGDFSAPFNLATTNSTSVAFTHGDLNTGMTALEAVVQAPNSMQLRVMATAVGIDGANSDIGALASSAVPVTINPFLQVVDYPVLYVPGGYQGWDPANENTVIFSVESDNTFEGYAHFADPNTLFKFTEGPNWDVNWGDTGADGILDSGGDNIEVAAAGTYRLNVDLNNLTYSAELANWGVVGDATPGGWDTDTDLVYDPATDTWRTAVTLGTGELKFRANDAWDLDLGDDDTNGIMEYGGANIPSPGPGDYIVVLKLKQAQYGYEFIPN